MGQTVNLLAQAFGGSNPSLPTYDAVGVAKFSLYSELEASSVRCIFAEVAQLIEQ